jgi:hypothetical protein
MSPNSRRIAHRLLFLICIVGLALAIGCNGDDTVRGEGSIDLPKSALKSYTSYLNEAKTKKPSTSAKKAKAAPKGSSGP